MKITACFLPGVTLVVLALSVSAQPTAKYDAPLASLTTLASPVVSLGLAANELTRPFDVLVANDEKRDLKVSGVQTTGGLYLIDFPLVIPAKGKATFTLLYASKPGLSDGADFLRILTDQGEKVVQINHARPQSVQFDTTALQWNVGDDPTPKAVVLTLNGTAAVPKSVKSLGPKSDATLQSLGGGRYRIQITPGSTAKAQNFPVVIEYAPQLPGANTVISCSISPKG